MPEPRIIKRLPNKLYIPLDNRDEIVINPPNTQHFELIRLTTTNFINFCFCIFGDIDKGRQRNILVNLHNGYGDNRYPCTAKLRGLYSAFGSLISEELYVVADITYTHNRTVRGTYLIPINDFMTGFVNARTDIKIGGFNPRVHGFIWNKDKQHNNRFTRVDKLSS